MTDVIDVAREHLLLQVMINLCCSSQRLH